MEQNDVGRRFTPEDAVLYLLGVCLLLWPAWFFARSMDQLQGNGESALQVIARDWKPATIGSAADRFLAAQLYISGTGSLAGARTTAQWRRSGRAR